MDAKANNTTKSTANDIVMTDPEQARRIVAYFSATTPGTYLDPCAGNDAFYNALPHPKYRCEIRDGSDFFDWHTPVDWIITNPPYSIYDLFLEHSFKVAKNVVFLVPISKAFKSDKIERMVDLYGGLKEIIYMGTGRQNGFPFGFAVGCLHYKKHYKGSIKCTKWYKNGSTKIKEQRS